MLSITTFILLGILGLFLYLLVKYPDKSIGTNERPDLVGPRGLPIIGNLIGIYLKGFTNFNYENLTKYGPNATSTSLGFGRLIAINDPECIEYVMKTNFENYIKPNLLKEALNDVLGDEKCGDSNENWRAIYLTQKIFVKLFEEDTKKLLNIMEAKVQSGETFDLQQLFFRFTLDTFLKITFGLDKNSFADPEEPVRFAMAFDSVQATIDGRFLNPFWKFTEIFSEGGRKMRANCKYLSEFAYKIIKKRRNDPKALKNPKDILNIFMNAKLEDGQYLTDKELRDIILNLIIAGRDTTAQTLSWMMYNVMVNPAIEQKMVNEINTLLSNEKPIPKYEDVKQFEFVQATLYETLRLHPSVPGSVKYCLGNDVLPNGTPVNAGELVIMSAWAMGRDERIWGADAKIFDPERFIKDKNGLKPSQYKFVSFNCGPRLCLGQNFATIEFMTLTTSLLRKYQFEIMPGQKSPPDFGNSVTLPMKDPLLVKVYRRN
ncbi:15461_t:CDS:2 [Funneliformis mosseae]|uniref:15461_t:CDS:1 n=1 Tax=Funneliformis mosseae TaxID=27381 RepID=A0A9N9DZP2_FUNMO|nr:15461_t:CDS:2 [Funneliformis mosseae]